MMRHLVWFREDLRVHDNTALFHASTTGSVIGIYIIDANLWKKHHVAACRVDFVLRGLQALREELTKLNIPLLTVSVKQTADIPQKLFEIIEQHQIDSLFFNRQYEFNENQRDEAVLRFLAAKNIESHCYDDQTILSPTCVLTQQGDFFKVFTPYKRAWYRAFSQRSVKLLATPKKQVPLDIDSTSIPDHLSAFRSPIDPALWPAGEKVAKSILKKFIEQKVQDYHNHRDFPAIAGTSQLSPYLSTGMISPRLCFLTAMEANHNEIDSGNQGAITWMSELIWREFYKSISIHVPRVSMNKAYNPKTENIPWLFNETIWHAWQNGNTGFPLIDAAMRQLNQTGWMHNRLRMITAMFLAKNLLFDWRLGEDYFMSHLIDGDLAANNGGWQWCASTGCDAVPYFRVFNPVTQSKRFDPEGNFIRQYCPELAKLDKKNIHLPLHEVANYPTPIIDLSMSRQRAILHYKKYI